MLKFLIKKCIPDSENVSDSKVRSAYGTLCSFYGIFINLVLFAAKFFAGTLSGSVAITADAFNNLSDAGSSLITFFGFRYAGKSAGDQYKGGPTAYDIEASADGVTWETVVSTNNVVFCLSNEFNALLC